MIDVEESIKTSTLTILAAARNTLLERGTYIPTAVLHTGEGLYPIILPYEDDDQKAKLIDTVKDRAEQMNAYAVSTITCARIVDTRTGEEEESLVLATAVQGGRPHILVQKFTRDEDRKVLFFDDITEGDAAGMPGQMMIYPNWFDQVSH